MATYPDHHEGITGRPLDPDGLLSLDMRAVPGREAVAALAKHLMTACMVGRPAPIVAAMGQRLRTPAPGDLVIERGRGMSRRSDLDTRIKALGYLIEHRDEWYDSAADWRAFELEDPDNATEDNRSRDHAWYIQYGPDPADVCRWTNCDFLMVPIGLDDDTAWRNPPDSVVPTV